MKKVVGKARYIITSLVCMIFMLGCLSINANAEEAMKPVKDLMIKKDRIVFTAQQDGYYNVIVTHVEADGSEKTVYLNENNKNSEGQDYYDNRPSFVSTLRELGTYNTYVFSEPEWSMICHNNFEEYKNDPHFTMTKGKSIKLTKKMPKPQNVELKEVMQDNDKKYKVTWKSDGYAHIFKAPQAYSEWGSGGNTVYLSAKAFKKHLDVFTKPSDCTKFACSDPVGFDLPEDPIDPEHPFSTPRIEGHGAGYGVLLPGYMAAVLYWEGENGVKARHYLSVPEYHDKPYSCSTTSTVLDEMFKNTGKYTLYVMWSAEDFDAGPIEEIKQNSKIKIAETSIEVRDRFDQPENVKIQEETIDGEKWYRITWDDDHQSHIIDYGGGASYNSSEKYILKRDYPGLKHIDLYTMTPNIKNYATSYPVIIKPHTGEIIYDPARQVGENAPYHSFPYHCGYNVNPEPATDPSRPTNPTEPEQPSEPTEPSNPTDPSQPSDPTDPSQPGDPGQGGGSSEQGNTPGTNPGQGGTSEQGNTPGANPGQGGSSGQGSSDQSKAPAVGNAALPATITVKGVTYKIGANGKATATKIGNVKKASINEVSVGGTKYPVTKIAAGAAKNNKKLTSVNIGKNVTNIGKKAFYNCKKLKKVTIKDNKSLKIGKKAFDKIHKDAVISR